MKKNSLFIILIIGIALAIGVWRDSQESNLAPTSSASSALPLSVGTALQRPFRLPEFSLTDINAKPFTNAALKKYWTFLFFGYSQCPQVCPATLSAMKQISESLGKGANTQFIFVTIDPDHDTPQNLKTYLQQETHMPDSFIGLTGNKETIHELAQHVGIHIAKEENLSFKSDHIEHGGALLLINPEGKLMAIFSSTEKTNAIVKDFKEIVHYYAQYA
ncbi:MAG: SCO family protein [Proteobacteria bacterium]|nr:SCO family protein [Pseudomonadota bacterium]